MISKFIKWLFFLILESKLVSNPPAYEQSMKNKEKIRKKTVVDRTIELNNQIKEAIEKGQTSIILRSHGYTSDYVYRVNVPLELGSITLEAIEYFKARGFELKNIYGKARIPVNHEEVNAARLKAYNSKKKIKIPEIIYQDVEYVHEIILSWDKKS